MPFVCFVYDVAMLSENPLRWVDPRTWPWPVYVWLAIIAARWLKPLWRRVQHSRAKSWPITTGQIESVTVNESKFRRRSSAYTAELGYSYSVSGKVEDGLYKREFNSEEEAWEFVRDLKGKPVAVHYNPDKPSASTLSEESVETLLRTRAPKPATEMPVSANHIPSMVSPFLWVFVILSAVGLVVSLWVHVGAVMGRRVAPEAFFWILHIGIFVVWFPAIFVAKARIGNFEKERFLEGGPARLARLDAIHGIWVFGVRRPQFRLVYARASDGGKRRKSSGHCLEGIFGTLDGFLFRCPCNPLFGGNRKNDRPEMR